MIVLGLTFLALAGFSLVAGWAFFSNSGVSDGLRTLGVIWPYLAGGGAVTAAFAALFMWLAFYSANHGYDDPIDPDGR
ncbi:hypothetical protein [Phenylobacterium sp.]|uniref:hypothetical protein n=1 Tax=Phenylobacterium sp. TaxID=1871053 RepID=UPI0035693CFE